MLLGLITTIYWIPRQEHGPDGTVKTLEQWEVGRETPNGFANTFLARMVEVTWKFLARIIIEVGLTVDAWVGGDARDRRDLARQERENEEEANRMREMAELQRGRSEPFGQPRDHMGSVGQREGQEERGPSPFVNESAHRA